ncbi:recombinase family protein [Microbacterium sp. A84]|uniref:recombinase family protein n=1 Tax=Microbacterium sp. A84 TaxID=3450715 RepID=UPI003F424097
MTTTSRSYGLARVSTDKQALDRQLDALRSAGVEDQHVIIEHGVSGDADKRDGLDELLRVARSGDTVTVAELSRLGRRTRQVLELVETLNAHGVTVRCLEPSLRFDGSPISQLLLSLLAAVGQMELQTIRIRTKEGLAAARQRGRVGGRPASLTDIQRREVLRMHAEGRSAADLSEVFGCSARTVRRTVSGTR